MASVRLWKHSVLAVVAVPADCLHPGVYHTPRPGPFLGITDAFQRPSVSQIILDIMRVPSAFSSYLAV